MGVVAPGSSAAGTSHSDAGPSRRAGSTPGLANARASPPPGPGQVRVLLRLGDRSIRLRASATAGSRSRPSASERYNTEAISTAAWSLILNCMASTAGTPYLTSIAAVLENGLRMLPRAPSRIQNHQLQRTV